MSSIGENTACPHCHWPPDGKAHWICESCQMDFNMFEDAGRCPRCYHTHDETQCISYAGGCGEISPHLDWYLGLDQGLKEINIFKNL